MKRHCLIMWMNFRLWLAGKTIRISHRALTATEKNRGIKLEPLARKLLSER